MHSNGNVGNGLQPKLQNEKSDLAQASTSGECLVTVGAQVMCWDETYNGWLPYEGGGVSNISLYQRLVIDDRSLADMPTATQRRSWSPGYAQNGQSHTVFNTKYQYWIQGNRIADQKTLLHCVLVKDLCYRQVMPTFHHWQAGKLKFGLSFLSSYDACKFHNRLQKAIEHLYRQSKSSSADSNFDTEELEDDVFVSVDLPLSHASSNSSSNRSSSAKSAPCQPLLSRPSLPAHLLGHKSHLQSRLSTKSLTPLAETSQSTALIELYQPEATTSYPYVYFKGQKHEEHEDKKPSGEYHYPSLPTLSDPTPFRRLISSPGMIDTPHPKTPQSRPSCSSLKLPPYGLQPIMLPLKKKGSKSGLDIITREQCFYCKMYYNTAENRPGCCSEAPSTWENITKKLSCYRCAECAVFCCLKEDGEYAGDVCLCSSNDPHRFRRWTVLTILAFFVPCLWCYLPLRFCGRSCRLRRARHRPAPRAKSSVSASSYGPVPRSTKSLHMSF